MAINVEAFYDMINGIAKQQVSAQRTDKTIEAKISKLYNADIGEYKVEYQGNIFSAFTVDPTVEYSRGEDVYVLVPEGDFGRKKIILGRSQYQNSLSEEEVTDLGNTYIPMGPNFLDEEHYLPAFNPLEICAIPRSDRDKLDFRNGDGARYKDCGFLRYPFTENIEGEPRKLDENPPIEREPYVRYPAAFLTDEQLKTIDDEFQNYAKTSTHICIEASFKTQFQYQHSSGEYGLQATFITKNPEYREEGHPQKEDRKDEIKYALTTFTLDFKSFNGSPYQLPNYTKQKAYFDIIGGELLGLYSLQLIQDGQFIADIIPYYTADGEIKFDTITHGVTDHNNIFATDLKLQFARKVDMLDTPFVCWIETPQGKNLFAPKRDQDGKILVGGRESITLIPHMIFKKQDVSNDCRYIWLREDLTIPDEYNPNESDRDENGRNYMQYAGPGWRPINHFIERNLITSYILNEDNSLTINRTYMFNGQEKETIPWQWRYKLIAIYGEEVFGYDIVTVTNSDSKYSLFVESFSSEVGHQMLRINDNNARVGVDVDPNGRPDYSILHKEGEQPPNNFYPEWFGTWFYELGDNSYNEGSTPYYHGPLDIQSFLHYQHINFRVICYDPHMVCPPTGLYDANQMQQVEPVGILNYEITSPDADGLLIEWQGEKSFNYTAMNKAYDSAYNQDHKLAVILNNVHGEQKGDGLRYDVTILAPDGIPLASQSYYNKKLMEDGTVKATDEGLGHEVANSMMCAMYVDSKNVIHFKLKDQFNIDYTANTFTAIVHSISDDVFYTSECPIIFTKDGQGGTQGSEWSAPVRLTNTQVMQHAAITYNGVNMKANSSEPFTLMVNNLRPLIIHPDTIQQGRQTWQEYDMPGYSDKNGHGPQLVIRPFVTKEGRALESIADIIEKNEENGVRNDHKHYKIIAHYDVRYPQNAALPRARGRSFLQLVDPETGMPPTDDENGYAVGNSRYCTTVWSGLEADALDPNINAKNRKHNAIGIKFKPDAYYDNGPAAFDFEEFKNKWAKTCAKFFQGTPITGNVVQDFFESLLYNKQVVRPFQEWPTWAQMATVENKDLEEGCYRMTSETAKDYLKYRNAYEDEKNQAPLSMEEMSYNFVVKCEIEIQTDLETKYKQYAADGSFVDVNPSTNAGVAHTLKTIVAYYPVDVFICNTKIREGDRFNVNNFFNNTYINWPTEVIYDSRGNNPSVDGADLEFFIDFQKSNQEKTLEKLIVPESMTPALATVQCQDAGLGLSEDLYVSEQNKRDAASYATKKSISPYKWKPRQHLNWQEGTVACLRGAISYLLEGLQLDGAFYRNQVYHLNSFENVDINGWDGQGIDINEENGTIFAPVIGAGFKGVFSNRFTGVLMGVNKGFERDLSRTSNNPFFLDPFNPTDIECREMEMNRFMTGIFGYQQGQSSFGLLENGTAFFGRADRGGRIIIDGYNACIYGGANGDLGAVDIYDPMWNNMRLNMVDLTHSVGGVGVDGSLLGFDGKAFGLNDYEDDYENSKIDSNDLPPWYHFIWEFSYISPRSFKPWFLNEELGLGEGYVTYGNDIDNQLRETPYKGKEPDQLAYRDKLPEFYAIGGYKGIRENDARNAKINYWQRRTLDEQMEMLMEYGDEGFGNGNLNKGSLDGTHPISGFGPSRASTTPAIEIGQHPEGLMPGLLPWGSAEYVLSHTFIPGNRNFMVTYDGTLWAMNGVFLGNVIGSNIVGGRLQGVELGVGALTDDVVTYYTYDNKGFCDFTWLINPYVTKQHMIRDAHANGLFSVSPDGDVIAKSIAILGGSIDIGSFHIMGGSVSNSTKEQLDASGKLLQLGESDFIGPTHFYGNVGIGPLLYPTSYDPETGKFEWGDGFDSDVMGKGIKETGNFFQTNGLVALGIYLPIEDTIGQREPGAASRKIDEVKFHNRLVAVNDLCNSNVGYLATSYSPGDPGIESNGDTVEQLAMFSVNTRTRTTATGASTILVDVQENKKVPGYMGHFWPLAFRYAKAGSLKTAGGTSDKEPVDVPGVHAYCTTMDMFKSKAFAVNLGKNAAVSSGDTPTGISIDGGNYFRVGPWGIEGTRMYICASWQEEQKSEPPTPDRRFPGAPEQMGVRGIIGLVDRAGTPDGQSTLSPAIGMTSWGKAPIILNSDDNYLVEVQGASYFLYGERLIERYKERKFTNWLGFTRYPAWHISSWRGFTEMNGGTNDISGDWSKVPIDDKGDKYYRHKFWLQMGVSFGNKGSSGTSHPADGVNATGFLMDPQDGRGYGWSGGKGSGAYLMWGKGSTGVHIFQHEDLSWNSGMDGEDSTELFLYQTQASLVSDQLLLIGTHCTSFSNISEGFQGKEPKDQGGNQNGLTHAPDTSKGAGMAFIDTSWRVSFKAGFSITGGTNLITDQNSGYHSSAKPFIGIGGDDNHTEYFHQNCVAIHQGTVGDGTSVGGKEVPKIFVGAGKSMDKGNKVWITDSKGGMEGIDGKVYMRDSWAIPDNQFCIYARFG